MEVIGQLTGGIAHDFNNMLTIVIGNLQLLERRSTADEKTAHIARAAMDASMRAAELVKRLLAFSRRQLLAPKNMCINDLVTDIEPLLVRTISATVILKTRLADDLWLARIDPSQLENTLLNLAINARDALTSGGTLTIETSNAVLDEDYTSQYEEVTPGEYVLIAVSDNGHGISEDVLSHVFEPFFSTKEVGKGTGLGLSMVYGFVKQSQGHIKIYSEEGHGTTIKIYIPRSKSIHADKFESTVRSKLIPGGDETILLVEDDDGVRLITQSLLSSLGYNVLNADSGQEALKLIAARDDVALLFTDIVMPGGMTGAELAQRALVSHPALKVLYTSGYTDTAVFDNGLLEHGCDLLSKPYTKEQLAQSVRDILDRE
jgi:CheY-like chemotaxis protein